MFIPPTQIPFPPQRRVLLEFEQRILASEISENAKLVVDEYLCCRFLRARQFDIERAVALYVSQLVLNNLRFFLFFYQLIFDRKLSSVCQYWACFINFCEI